MIKKDRRYKVCTNPIGKGAFGSVFTGTDTKTSRPIACKRQSNKNKYEYNVLLSLYDTGVVPEPLGYEEDDDGGSSLYMQLFDHDLTYISLQSDIQSNPPLLMGLAYMIFRALRKIHDRGWIHRDVKPGNIMVRRGTSNVHLIDFGMAKKFMDRGKHIPYREDKRTIVGTAKYLSLWGHRYIEQSRRDDCESALFSLAQIAKRRLPWIKYGKNNDNKQKIENIYSIKKRTTPDELFVGLPRCLAEVLYRVRKLKFYQRPQYEEFMELFLGEMKKKNERS